MLNKNFLTQVYDKAFAEISCLGVYASTYQKWLKGKK